MYSGCFDTCPCSQAPFPSNSGGAEVADSQPIPLQPREVCALNEFPSMVHVFLALPWLWEVGMSRVDYARSK